MTSIQTCCRRVRCCTASPVPHLTSLYPFHRTGEYGNLSYSANCGGNFIADLLRFYKVRSVIDPITGSGTCRDVCEELGIYCYSSDLHQATDACDPASFPRECFEFAWLHPPHWRQKLYQDHPLDLSRTPTLDAFLDRYRVLIATAAGTVISGGRLAILMGDSFINAPIALALSTIAGMVSQPAFCAARSLRPPVSSRYRSSARRTASMG
jgi:hypothetical protein